MSPYTYTMCICSGWFLQLVCASANHTGRSQFVHQSCVRTHSRTRRPHTQKKTPANTATSVVARDGQLKSHNIFAHCSRCVCMPYGRDVLHKYKTPSQTNARTFHSVCVLLRHVCVCVFVCVPHLQVFVFCLPNPVKCFMRTATTTTASSALFAQSQWSSPEWCALIKIRSPPTCLSN